MSISLTLNQVTSAAQTAGTATYTVTNTVTASVGISPAVFVFFRDTAVFDHYATVADLSLYPDSQAAALAQGVNYFRQPTVVRTWNTIDLMNADLTITRQRLQSLLNETSEIQNALIVNTTTVLSA